jgi:cystathionine beta-lyase/cystathionine gamma-synthase
MDISYIINRLGEENEDYFGAIAPPIMQTSNFSYKKTNDLRTALKDEKNHLIYSRGNNPTVDILCKKLAALEGADEAIVFASGMAAISTAVISNLKSGDHVICVQKPYSWTSTLFRTMLPRFGITTDFVDGTDIVNFEKAILPSTRLIYLESPNTMTFELQDIKAVVELAKKNNIITIIDNSYSTPLCQQPIAMGIDIVVHSATKYIGGHSDAVAGVLCTSAEMADKIFRNDFLTLGGIISPFNSWLLLRGLRTLPIRMEKISASTQKIIAFLKKHPAIEKIYYPYDSGSEQFKIAEKQMSSGTGLFSFQLKTKNVAAIEKFCESLKYFQIAVSWGGYESLIFPVCAFIEREEASELPINLLRISVGIEDADALIEDLKCGLDKIELAV